VRASRSRFFLIKPDLYWESDESRISRLDAVVRNDSGLYI
jgi:hypothetical protein